jgi:hypothetical protein
METYFTAICIQFQASFSGKKSVDRKSCFPISPHQMRSFYFKFQAIIKDEGNLQNSQVCFYHSHVHSRMGTMIGRTAVVSVFGAQVVTLS